MSLETPPIRIYYADETYYEGEPENAPAVGVIAIVEPDPDCGVTVLHKWDIYCWHPHEQLWYGHNETGARTCFVDTPGLRRQIFGQTVPSPQFRRVYHAALKYARENGQQFASKREAPWP